MWIWVRMKSVGDDLLWGREVLSWSLRILLQTFFRSVWFFISIITPLYIIWMFSFHGITSNVFKLPSSHSSMHVHDDYGYYQSAVAVCT